MVGEKGKTNLGEKDVAVLFADSKCSVSIASIVLENGLCFYILFF